MISIAIVEDRSDFRELWSDILNHSEGYSLVGAFANAQDAIDALSAQSVDVVLMDIHLNDNPDGITCVKELKKRNPNTRFLMFTVFEDEELIFKALSAGANGYILKNTAPTKVLDAIQEMYNGGGPMSPAIARLVLESFHNKPKPELEKLTPREIEVLELLAKGLLYKEIATELDLSPKTIAQYSHSIYQKLEVNNRTEALNKYLR